MNCVGCLGKGVVAYATAENGVALYRQDAVKVVFLDIPDAAFQFLLLRLQQAIRRGRSTERIPIERYVGMAEQMPIGAQVQI